MAIVTRALRRVGELLRAACCDLDQVGDRLGVAFEIATLASFFDALGPERSAQITHVSADGAAWIAAVVATKCPNAIRCADPFYVTRLLAGQTVYLLETDDHLLIFNDRGTEIMKHRWPKPGTGSWPRQGVAVGQGNAGHIPSRTYSRCGNRCGNSQRAFSLRTIEHLLSIDYSSHMDMSVAEYAQHRGISRQRALRMIRAGQINARRIGRSWVIDQRELNQRSASGRPLGKHMASILIDVISGHPLELLNAQDRFFAASYLDRLRGAEDPARLIHSWMKSRQLRVVNVAANPADLSDVARDDRVVASGISDERSEMSAAREFEGYVAAADLDAFLRNNLLVESESPNVRLHVVDERPPRPIPLGLVLADLADWNRPREDGRVVELLRGTAWSR